MAVSPRLQAVKGTGFLQGELLTEEQHRWKKATMGAMVKTVGIFWLLGFCFGCFFHNETAQYIAIKDGKKFRPYAKVGYRVSVDRQEVVYWVEFPGKDRSQLYPLKKCSVADLNNWEGEADHILLWKIKVKVMNGEFGRMGEGLANISWFAWHFETDPKPTIFFPLFSAAQFIFFIVGILIVLGSFVFLIFSRGKKLSLQEMKRRDKDAGGRSRGNS